MQDYTSHPKTDSRLGRVGTGSLVVQSTMVNVKTIDSTC
jgi:hypothetical protein